MSKRISIFTYLILTVVPLGIGLIYAFLYSIGAIGALNNGVTATHWTKVFSEGDFVKSLLFSMTIAGISLFISTAIALFICTIWQPKTKENAFVFYLPLSIPPLIAAFLTFQFLSNSGIISRILYQFGWLTDTAQFTPLINDRYNIGVIFTQVLLTFPYFTLVFFNIYQNEKIALLSEIASTLGAEKRQLQRQIMLPILLQKAKNNLLLCFIFLMSAYEIPLLLGSQSPPMLSILVAQKFRKYNLNDIPQAYVMTVIYALIILILVSFFMKIKNEKNTL